MNRSKSINIIVLAFLLGLMGSCNFVHDLYNRRLLTKSVIAELEQEKGKFKNFGDTNADTLNFDKLTDFSWDTLYWFKGDIDWDYVSRELYEVDWRKGFMGSHMIEEDKYRFVFVKDRKAVNYIDVPSSLFQGIHFSKYYEDEDGNLVDYYYDSSNPEWSLHEFTLNKWPREESKFIMVAYHDGSSGTVYADLAANDSSFRGNKPDYFYLHPVEGCRYENCLANQKNNR